MLALLMLLLASLAAGLPPAAGTVVYAPNASDYLTSEQNVSLALNEELSSTLRSRVALADPVEEAISVATAAIEARKRDLEDEANQTRNLTPELDLLLLNLGTVREVRSALQGPGSNVERALAVADVGISTRGPALAHLGDDRLAGYLATQAANVETTRALLALDPGTLAGLAGASARATSAQAEALGVTLPASVPTPSYASPSEAIVALLREHGVEPTPEDLVDLAAVDDLPGEARAAVRSVVEAFIALERATVPPDGRYEAFRALVERALLDPEGTAASAVEAVDTASEINAEPGLAASMGMDLGPALRARQALVEAASALGPAAQGASVPCERVVLPRDPIPEMMNFSIVSIALGDCADTHPRDVVLSIDLGGNDTYLNNAGGNRLGNLCERDENRIRYPPGATAAIDVGGSDLYHGSACGVNGGAALGVGVLVDLAGDDDYRVNATGEGGAGANGGGHGGVGFLLDAAGNDHYVATSYGVNGGGFVGLGTLIDGGGTDVYDGGFVAVNGGGEHGVGFVFDGGGNDQYLAGSRSSNGAGFAGSGYLLDVSGDDKYLAPFTGEPTYSAGTNGGGRVGTGYLADALGNDEYVGDRDGANGGGWFGVGLLVDAAGNDNYTATDNGTNGAGWGRPGGQNETLPDAPMRVGLGMLVDVEGRDNYTAGSFATNAGCYVGGSFFVDALGNDNYTALDGGGVNGGAGGHVWGLCVAFLYDAAGNDKYEVLGHLNPRGHKPYEVEFGGGKGANGGAGGVAGVGFLFDAAGDDDYVADRVGVNGGAWQGVGLLVDALGDDDYKAGNFGGNGGGYVGYPPDIYNSRFTPVASFGFLVDISGNDDYVGGNEGQNGGGLLATGFLYDGLGTDTYTAGDAGVNGGGAGGVGFLLDVAGSDEYVAGDRGVNGGGTNWTSDARGVRAGIGLLTDVRGTDHYQETGLGCRRDETRVPKADRGAGAQQDFEGVPMLVCA